MFLALQLKVQTQLFILHHEYKCLASNLPTLTICVSILFLQDVFKGLNVTSETTAVLMTPLLTELLSLSCLAPSLG